MFIPTHTISSTYLFILCWLKDYCIIHNKAQIPVSIKNKNKIDIKSYNEIKIVIQVTPLNNVYGILYC